MQKIEGSTSDAIEHQKYKNIISDFSLTVADVLKERFEFSRPIEFYSGKELLKAIAIENESVICEVNNVYEIQLDIERFDSDELISIFNEINDTLSKKTDYKIKEGKLYYPVGNPYPINNLSEIYEYLIELI